MITYTIEVHWYMRVLTHEADLGTINGKGESSKWPEMEMKENKIQVKQETEQYLDKAILKRKT